MPCEVLHRVILQGTGSKEASVFERDVPCYHLEYLGMVNLGGGIRSPKIFFVLKFHVEFEVHNSMKEETYFDI